MKFVELTILANKPGEEVRLVKAHYNSEKFIGFWPGTEWTEVQIAAEPPAYLRVKETVKELAMMLRNN